MGFSEMLNMNNLPNKRSLGNRGEAIAVRYLTEQGYQIIATNFACIFGEIDIIALHQECRCFIEVKLRKNLNFGYGYEAVTYKKQQHLIKTALYYLTQQRLFDVAVRFDILSIDYLNDSQYKITLIQNAFRQ